ncbi:MAG: phosphoribosylglycinamide formyltransferase [Alphaproteobacteria bacterium]
MDPIPTAILISGRGSNMSALLDAAEHPDYPAKITLVLSNNPDAPGLHTAKTRRIATCVIDHRTFADRAGFDAAIDRSLRDAGIELICLAGFMRILTAKFVAAWPQRILNIHPSLLPAFKGLDTHTRAIAAGTGQHGASVHFVSAELDAGPVIMRESLAIAADDTPQSLASRVLEIEHRLYPQALAIIAGQMAGK